MNKINSLFAGAALMGSLLAFHPAWAEDADPGTFTIPNVEFNEKGVATVNVYFQTEIPDYCGLMMDFIMPTEYKIESDSQGVICTVDPNFSRRYNFAAIADRTTLSGVDYAEQGLHFYRFVGFGPVPTTAEKKLFFSFNILAPATNQRPDKAFTVNVEHIEFSPKHGDEPAYKNTFPDMEFTVNPYNAQTGVENVEIDHVNDGIIYDTLGHKLGTDPTELQPGIYILNGEKILIQ